MPLVYFIPLTAHALLIIYYLKLTLYPISSNYFAYRRRVGYVISDALRHLTTDLSDYS